MPRAKTADATRRPVAREPGVWTRLLGQFVTRAERLGVPRAQLLTRTQVTEQDLEDPDARVPVSRCYAVLEEAVSLSSDPLLHLRMTRDFEFESFDAVACLAMSCSTLRASLRAMLRYQRLWSEGEGYHFTESDGWGRIVYTPWGPARVGQHLMAEVVAVDLAVNAAFMTGGAFDGPRVLLRHATQRGTKSAQRELFGGIAVERGRPRDEVWIRTRDLDRRMAPEGREAVYRFFERYLDEKVRAMPESLSARVSQLLMRDVAKYDRLEVTAKALHMSPRTLQRKLAEHGTTLRTLADESRRARALALIETGHSIAEIAWLLGFAEPSVFHRVFRRWTGTTPELYRRELRATWDRR